MCNELGNSPVLEYHIVGSFKQGDLNKPCTYDLSDHRSKMTTPLAILSQPYRLVYINCYHHASGLIADERNNIYFYNANDPKGSVKFDAFNLYQLEETIFNAHGYKDEAILSIKCFHFDKDTSFTKPPLYPEPNQILKNLSGNTLIPHPQQNQANHAARQF